MLYTTGDKIKINLGYRKPVQRIRQHLVHTLADPGRVSRIAERRTPVGQAFQPDAGGRVPRISWLRGRWHYGGGH